MLPELGAVISRKHVFAQSDFDEFARLSGDDNPIHVDAEFSARTRFGRTVSHGMLLYGMICGLLSDQFPGSAQVSQQMKFTSPTFVGEELAIHAEVVALDQAADEATLSTVITADDGRITFEGETVLKWV